MSGSGSGLGAYAQVAQDDVVAQRLKANKLAGGTVDAKATRSSWTDKYKEIMTMTCDTAQQRLTRAVCLRKLYQSFEAKAVETATVLVRESHLPFDEKTIKPVNKGGVAGGEKFIVDGIYFKYSRDWCAIYGGDHNAMRAAGHELLSIKKVIALEHQDLCTPLISMIDYCGHRIIAMSLIPIDDTTLVYGSSDGGKTVVASNDRFNTMMKEIATQLNLKKHFVGSTELYTPGDLEGHLGADNSFYLVDAARLFPPEAPLMTALYVPLDVSQAVRERRLDECTLYDQEKWLEYLCAEFGVDKSKVGQFENGMGITWSAGGEERNERASLLMSNGKTTNIYGDALILRLNKSRVLYRLLRPELVLSNKTPLCSDAYTQFQTNDPNQEMHNSEVTQATQRLLGEVIRDFAAELNKHEITPVNHKELADLMHQRGINMRFLGRLHQLVTVPHLSCFILTEMVSRTVKNNLRRLMRSASSDPEAELKRKVVRQFNVIFGNSPEADKFWSDIKVRLQFKFIDSIQGECAVDYDLRDDILLFSLFQRVCETTGVDFKRGAQQRLFEHPYLFRGPQPLSTIDLGGFKPICRSAVDHSHSIIKFIKAAAEQSETDSMKLAEKIGDDTILSAREMVVWLKVHQKIENILGPDSPEAVASYYDLAERYLASGDFCLALDYGIRGLTYGEVLFGRHSEITVRGTVLVGRILEKMRDYAQAISYYMRACESVQRLHRQHPLTGKLNAKIYFCLVAQRNTSASCGGSIQDEHQQHSCTSGACRVGGSAKAAELAAGTALATDPKYFLQQSVDAYTAMYGHDAALAAIALIGLDHNDREWVDAVQAYVSAAAACTSSSRAAMLQSSCHATSGSSPEPGATTTSGPIVPPGSSLLCRPEMLWPQHILEQVHVEDTAEEASMLAPSSPHARRRDMTLHALNIGGVSAINEESLRSAGITSAAKISRVMAAAEVILRESLPDALSGAGTETAGSLADSQSRLGYPGKLIALSKTPKAVCEKLGQKEQKQKKKYPSDNAGERAKDEGGEGGAQEDDGRKYASPLSVSSISQYSLYDADPKTLQ